MSCVTSYLSQIIGEDQKGFTYLINYSGFKVTMLIHAHSNCFIVHQVFMPKTGSVPSI